MSSKPTVLLIDENPAVAEIITALLTRNGYQVEVLTTGEKVHDLLGQREVDVIVSDVRGTSLDGIELARRVRNDPATADIPIILLTAMASIEDEFEGYLAGADAYMTKPFRARELLAAIDNVLNRRTVSTSSGRLAVVQDVARVLAVVADERHRMVTAAMRQAGFELDYETELARAMSRIDRERFHLLICDTARDPQAVGEVREFLSHFALAIPVIFLHPRGAAPVLPLNDPQFHSLKVPATPAALAELVRKAILDFGGPP
ncbi:MAG: response regulator [Planctomycetes bacterium]|nr:response regulator [Planctomycetota bacterium]